MTYLFRHLTPKSLLYRWLLYWRWIPRTVLLALSAATTAIGVGSGVAVEVNPLVTSPAAFAGLMLARVDVSDQAPFDAMARLGLKLVQRALP